ncbi:cadherin repeat domain-containing protein [Vibrio brasiliensis]|uniref:cadherin repeat domain-containing protein n=1 Tax=Vibrio brasiliensis TaxID=170652 RepID=UPI001EFEA852|nr:cadherin repeat domain-containing protein [Vibrio brasiliensis]MCG9725445.1 cadherin domain-containing protein [Vibrio brasiliensis]
MNAKSLAPFMLANTTVVIDINGDVRELLPGEVPGPGEVIVVLGQGATANADVPAGIEAQLVGEDGNLDLNLDNEIASIIEQIEQGVDPTQNEDFATAAGGQNGSSLTGSGDIERTGDETLAETEFDTTGLESQGLSETQSLTLVDIIAAELIVEPEAPVFDAESYDFSYDENSEPGTVLGTVSATDLEGDAVTYSLVFEEGDPLADYFDIDPDTGEITLTEAGAAAFTNDFEDEGGLNNHVVVAQASDGTNISQVVVTLNELDVNESPEFSDEPEGGYEFSYNENSTDDYVIGTVTATDVDAGDVVTYSISSNIQFEGEDLFEIDSESGEISLTAAGVAAFTNDFELAGNEHTITVVASDGELETSVEVDLTELDVNEAPEFNEPEGGYEFTYNENSTEDYVIGTVTATDEDAGDVVTYSISSNIQFEGEDLFEIDSESGEISLTAAGVAAFTNDFELAGNEHTITVVASDGELETSVEVDLTELDVNEAPEFNEPEGGYEFTYNENSAEDYVIGTVTATDEDAGDVITYSITTNIQFEGQDLFEIDSETGEISLTDAGVAAFTNDFELAGNEHTITVMASDGELDTEVDVDLTELDVNEAPEFDEPEGGYEFSYNENSTEDYVIGTVTATDEDAGDVVTYSISENIQFEGEDLFAIDSESGEISLTAAGVAAFTNDFELDANLHTITVVASDGDLETEVEVDLIELDVNEAPEFDEPEGGYEFSYNENSTEDYVIGTVTATDEDAGDVVTYSISENIQFEGEDLFAIDSESGEISLTAAGVAAFTNDFELGANLHTITVVASDGELETEVEVDLIELDVNEAPEFDEPEGGYEFSYNENSTEDYVIGTVTATDEDAGDVVTYSISQNIQFEGQDLFEINSENGQISLTAAGVLAFTNNFELLSNEHTITVMASDGELDTEVLVDLSELDVNELPVTEDFNVDAGDAIFVPIVFDSDDESLDHISDEDDDFNGIELNVMITSLPQFGTLLYTDDFGETRVITEADLHVLGEDIDPAKLFDPDNFTYVPGPGEPFEIGYSGDPDDIVLDEDGFYNWGEWVSDTERLITLDNGNTIGISIEDNNDKPLKQYTGGPAHVGWGIGDTDGNGMNKQETLIIDLSNNPLDVVTFGLDGMGGSFNTNSNVYVEVTYTFADGTTHVEQYQKDEGDVGNEQILYEFSYSSPDNPIVQMELTSTGGNWELRYLSGTQDITEDVTFDYVAVDSELAVSNESTVTIDVSDSPEYEVLSAAEGDELDADLGNQVMLGDETDNMFTWLDSTLDNGTDVVDNFELGSDLIDLRGILEEDDNVLVGDLIDSISAEVDGDDIVMTVTDDGREQTIVLEGVTAAFEEAGLVENNAITNELEMLTQVLKTDAA